MLPSTNSGLFEKYGVAEDGIERRIHPILNNFFIESLQAGGMIYFLGNMAFLVVSVSIFTRGAFSGSK
jgi:hypothetical protein